MMLDQQKEELSKPLNRAHVKQREQAGRTFDYIEGWHAIEEANRIFGFDGWTRETILLTETSRDLVTLKDRRGQDYQQWRVSYIAKVRVTALGVAREGTGYGSGMGKPEAIGDAIEGAVKEAETDAMKRALMTFGNPFGLALYDKTQANVQDAPPEPKPASKADSRETYTRLSKANRDCKTEDEFTRLWTHPKTHEALGTLPKDWLDKILDEQRDKQAELAERAALQEQDYVPPNFDKVA